MSGKKILIVPSKWIGTVFGMFVLGDDGVGYQRGGKAIATKRGRSGVPQRRPQPNLPHDPHMAYNASCDFELYACKHTANELHTTWIPVSGPNFSAITSG